MVLAKILPRIAPARGRRGALGVHDGCTPEVFVASLSKNDILLGRGTGPNQNAGNIRFRQTVHEQEELLQAQGISLSRNETALKILSVIKERRGRFLRKIRLAKKNKRSPAKEAYYVVKDSDALQKIKQALRYQKKGHDLNRSCTSDYKDLDGDAAVDEEECSGEDGDDKMSDDVNTPEGQCQQTTKPPSDLGLASVLDTASTITSKRKRDDALSRGHDVCFRQEGTKKQESHTTPQADVKDLVNAFIAAQRQEATRSALDVATASSYLAHIPALQIHPDLVGRARVSSPGVPLAFGSFPVQSSVEVPTPAGLTKSSWNEQASVGSLIAQAVFGVNTHAGQRALPCPTVLPLDQDRKAAIARSNKLTTELELLRCVTALMQKQKQNLSAPVERGGNSVNTGASGTMLLDTCNALLSLKAPLAGVSSNVPKGTFPER